MPPPPLSDAEWKVMNAVWARRSAVSGREVQATLAEDTGWAYTTVKTMLDRLVEKGALAAVKERNVTHYRSKLPRQRAIAAAVRTLADRAFGGAIAPLAHHVVGLKRLSAEDRAELRRMLDTADTLEADREDHDD